MSLVDVWTSVLTWLSWAVGVRRAKASQIGAGKTVVIVGGGFAGATLAHYLEATSAYDVVLYERRDFFEYTPSMLRVMRDPEHMSVSHLLFKNAALLHRPRIRIVHDEVVEIGQSAVRGRNGVFTHFDKLVLAMGSDYADHLKPEPCCHTLKERTAHVKGVHSDLSAAKRITVFGGGLVGVELVAELVEAFPEAKVIFRQREDHLLPGFPKKAQEYALRFFAQFPQCEVVLENTVAPRDYKISGPPGEEVVFNCTGLTPVPLPHPAGEDKHNSKEEQQHQHKVLQQAAAAATKRSNKKKSGGGSKSRSSSPSVVSSPAPVSPWPVHSRTSLMRVTRQLHLVGHEHIFCMGDVIVEDDSLDEPSKRAPKVAYQAELQAWCVAENLRRQGEAELESEEAESGKAPRPEWRFPDGVAGTDSTPTLVCCTLGKRDGLLIFNNIVLTGWLPVLTKHLLERTKMAQLRGEFVGEAFWTIVEPISLAQHRLYKGVAKLFGGNKDDKQEGVQQ